jgi:hypothetical protein
VVSGLYVEQYWPLVIWRPPLSEATALAAGAYDVTERTRNGE